MVRTFAISSAYDRNDFNSSTPRLLALHQTYTAGSMPKRAGRRNIFFSEQSRIGKRPFSMRPVGPAAA